ncbi:MAG: guanylate kinase [Bacteroidetes bacterium]|nr:guanylate kinase [Bacteroidota bacterium]
MNNHKLIIITAPSGSGKTTIVNHLLRHMPELAFSISACTRKPRTGEVDGINYYFITPEEFTKRIEQNEFAEYEMVYTNKYYGTLKSELSRIWNNQKIPLVDIDVHGAQRLKKYYTSNALTLFIQAPDIQALEERLRNRESETEESITERLNKANEELSYANQFDHIIINDRLEIACENAERLIKSFLND